MAATVEASTAGRVSKPSPLGLHARVGVFGALLGFTVTSIGFGDFAELNAMFTFQDFRMLFAFAGGVALAVVGFRFFGGPKPASPRIHKGVVPGAVMFGVGWAISGGCPSIPIIQVATGYLPALVTIAGIVVGTATYRKLNGRYLRLDTGSCGV